MALVNTVMLSHHSAIFVGSSKEAGTERWAKRFRIFRM